MTPDGPRGPARVAKPGAVAAAQRSGAAIMPVGIGASPAWRAPSWDRFLVPSPFAKVRMVYGEPFGVPANLGGMRRGVEQLNSSLEHVTHRAQCSR
jgi:lysophospholipid acyltransferase (LPLAT)-like uncharacterized protein